MRRGIEFEPREAMVYANVAKGGLVNLYPSGLLINLKCPWLGCSQDSKVYDNEAANQVLNPFGKHWKCHPLLDFINEVLPCTFCLVLSENKICGNMPITASSNPNNLKHQKVQAKVKILIMPSMCSIKGSSSLLTKIVASMRSDDIKIVMSSEWSASQSCNHDILAIKYCGFHFLSHSWWTTMNNKHL